MLLKTYRGSDLTGTLNKIRRELGPDALVLGTSEQKKRFGVSGVEVTVAVPRDRAPASDDDTEVRRLAREVRELRDALRKTGPETPPERRRVRSPEAATERRAAPSRADEPAGRSIVERLVSIGVEPVLAERFRRIAARTPSAAAAASREVASLVRFAPLPLGGRCLFMVGPPGSGKTTTAAKIASRLRSKGRDVVFGVADGDRIGSFEQAQIYSRYIGAQAARIDGPDDLQRALDLSGEQGFVLVDTCGIGARDERRLAALGELREVQPEADAVVLVPAGLHHEEAGRTMDRFDELEPTCVAWSRVDDNARHGDLFTALARRTLPLSFVTNGHVVPHDLEPATPQRIASMLLSPLPMETSA